MVLDAEPAVTPENPIDSTGDKALDARPPASGADEAATGTEGTSGPSDAAAGGGCDARKSGEGSPSRLKDILSGVWGRKVDPGEDAALAADVQSLRNALADLDERQQSNEDQGELARIANLLPNADILQKNGRMKNLALCLDAFNGSPPNAVFIAAVRSDCELTVLRSQRGMFRFVYRVSGSTPISATLSGLIFSALSMLLVSVCLVGMASKLQSIEALDKLPIPWALFNTMLILAAVGSFVSVLSRLGQLQSNRGYDAFLVFATGFFKPWIGVAFGAFLFFVLHSHLLNIAALTDNSATGVSVDNEGVYCVLAFISGFSERLVSDFITRTGSTILGPPAAPVPKAEPPLSR